jgi:hypothetical protein
MAAVTEYGGEESWSIREVYYESANGGVGWTADDMDPHGSTREELIRDLHMMLADTEDGTYLDLRTETVVGEM